MDIYPNNSFVLGNSLNFGEFNTGILSKSHTSRTIPKKFCNTNFTSSILTNYAKGFIAFRAYSGLNFNNLDLTSHSFDNKSLSSSIFTQTKLKNASFKNSYLHKSRFNGAFMPGVKMNNKTDCSHCNFSNAWLCNSELNGANMYKSNFIGANLADTDIFTVKVKKAVFDATTEFPAGFDPKDAGMVEIKKYEDLSDSDFAKMSLRYNDLSDINFSNSNFEKADLKNTDFSKSNLKNANLKYAYLKNANLRGANLQNIKYNEYTNFEKTQFDSKTILPSGLCATEYTIPNNAIWVND